ncbi:filamentous hemagglutinin family outer membrane protein [Synechococcus sp. RS9909]|nr:filamentous hemagglutinin family outer membrane protein [Synechococcus sp. RS9909]
MNLAGAFLQDGAGSSSIAADITTTDDNITFQKAVTLTGNVLLDSGAGAGTIAFNSSLDSKANAANTLTLTAGSGNIDFDGTVGSATNGALGAVTINSANNLTADDVFNAASLRQVAGSGTSTFSGALSTTAADGIELDGTNFNFNDTVTLTLGNLDLDSTGTVRFNGLVTTSDESAGLVTITNGGALTLTATGDMNLAGAFLQDGAGSSSIAADITTTDDTITFQKAVTLTGNVLLDTGAGAGTIAFNSSLDSKANEAHTLTLTAGTGDITFDGAVGSATDGALGAVTINSANNLTADAVFNAASLRQVAGSGTSTFSGALSTTAADGIELDGTNFNFNDTVTLTLGNLDLDSTGTVRFNGLVTTSDESAGLVTITNGGALTLTATGDMNLAGAFLQDGAGSSSIAADITTTDDTITFQKAVTLTGNVLLDTGAGAGTIAFNSSLDSKANEAHTLTLTAGTGDITFDGAVGSATNGALGSVTINSANNLTADQSITAASFSQNAGTGTSSFDGALNLTGAFDFTGQALTLNAAGNTIGGAMTVANAGTFTTADTADLSITGAFQQTGNGSSSLGANLTATGGIAFAKAIALTGSDAVVLATGGASGQDITLGSSTSTGISGTGQALTLNAGSAGDITITGAIGANGSALGAITVSNGDQVAFQGAITAASYTQAAAASTGLTTFDGALNLSGAFDFTGQALTLNDSLNSGSSVEITNAGLLTTAAAADITATAGFTQNGAGSSSIAGNITTTDSNISFLRAVTLTGPVALSTDSGAGDITFSDTLDATSAGAQDLTLTAGSGDITFSGVVGGTTRLGGVTINQAADVNLSNAFSAASFSQASGTAGTGIFTLGGDLNTDTGAITIDSKEVALNANLTTTAGSTNGLVTINAGVGDANGLALTLASGNTITTTAATAGTQSGAITINSDGNVALAGNLITTGSAGAAGGNVTITTTGTTATLSLSDITTSGGAAASSSNGNGGAAGSISIGLTTTGTITLNNSSITAAGGLGDGTGSQGAGTAISFSNAVALTTGAATVDTGATGGDISFLSTINGAQNLTLTAGTGDITLSGAVGGDVNGRLGALTIASANDLSAAAITAASLTQQAGSGTATFSGAINTNTAAGISLTGTNLVLNGSLTTTTGGTLTIAQSGTASIAAAADINADGAVSLTANGGITTAADITTTGDNVTVASATTLSGPIAITTGGGNLIFSSTLDSDANGGRALTITAGSGDITFSGDVGTAGSNNAGRLGAITIASAGNLTATGALNAGSYTQTTGTGLSTFGGAIDLTGAFAFSGEALTLNAALNSGSTVTVTNAGTFSTAAAADITATSGFTQNGTGSSSIAGDITTDAAGISFSKAITLTGDLSLSTGSGTDAGDIAFSETINSDGTARALTLTAGAGDVVFQSGATVGTSSTAGSELASLTISGAALTLRDVTTSGDQTFTASGGINTNSTYTSSGGAISFTGDTVINDALTINTTAGGATGGNVAFSGTLDSKANAANNLSITAGSGNITFSGLVGDTTPLGAVTIASANDVTVNGLRALSLAQTTGTGTTALNGGTFSSGTDQALGTTGSAGVVINNAAISLADSIDTTSSGVVTLNATGGALTIAAAGDINADGTVSLTVTGGINTAGDITTTADNVSLNSPVTLTGDVAINTGAGGGNISFSDVINSDGTPRALTLTANSGNVTLAGIAGTSNSSTGRLASLTVASATNAALNNVFSTGAQSITATGISLTGTTYDAANSTITLNGAAVLEQNTAITAATTSFAGTLDSSNNGASPAVSDFRTLAVTGNAVFDGAVGNAYELGSLSVTGTSALNGGSIKTSGLQTYTGAVTLAANTTLTSGGGAITFDSTLNGGYTLAVNTTGTTTFSGAVGNSTALVSLSTDAGGSTAINGGSIATSGAAGMVFGDAVSLGAATTLTATNGAITFSDTLDSDATAARTLTLTAGSGDITFSEITGGTNRLGAATINQADDVTIAGGKAFSAASFSQASGTAGTGTFTLGGDLNTDTGAITISSATVDLNASITTTAGGANGLVTINAGSGGLDLASGKSITTTATTAGTQSGAIDINSDGNINLIGDLITTGSAGAAGGNVTIDTTGTTATLSISDITTSGGAAASSSNGNGGAAGSIGLTTTGTITLNNSSITAAGGLGNGTGSQGAGAAISFSNAVALTTGAATVDTGATGGDIAFSSTINGAQGLTLTAGTGTLTLSGDVNVASVDASAATINIDGGTDAVTTTTAQLYTGAVVLGSNTTLTADNSGTLSSITFDGSLDSSNDGAATPASNFRTLGITGNAVFDGAVGSSYALGGLTVSGTSALDGSSINTTGAQTYTAAVTLAANTTLTSGGGAISFGSTLNSDGTARDLTLTAGSGDIDFDGIIGGAQNGALGAVTINAANNVTLSNTFSAASFSQATAGGGTFQLGGNLTASTGAITINSNAVDLNADLTADGSGQAIAITGTTDLGGDLSANGGSITFNSPVSLTDAARSISTGSTGGDITFSGTLNGAQDLTLTAGSGDITFSDTVGGSTRLGALTINSATNVTVADTKAFSAASIKQQAGSGTTTFGGTLNTNAQIDPSGTPVNLNGIDLSGSAFTFKGGVTTTGGGAVAIDNSGLLTIGNSAAFSLDGAFAQSGGGSINLGAGITTTDDDIAFSDAITLTNGVSLSTGSGTGTISFSGDINSDSTARALTLTAGTGDVVFQSAADVGTAAAGSELASLSISGNNLTLRNVTTTGAQTFTATTGINTNSTYTSSGGAITFAGDTVINDALVINTTAGGATGGAVTFSGTLDSESTEANTLAITAGNAAIDFDGAVGSALNGALGAVTIHSAGNLTADVAFKAASYTQSAAAAGSLSRFDGALTLSGAFDFIGQALTINGAGNTIGGAMTVANAGTFTTTDNADLSITAAFQQTGNGTSSLGANLTATGGISFAKAIALTGTDAVVLATGGAAGQDITIGTSTIPAGITGSGQDLTLNAGSDGDISVTAAIGASGSTLGAITITGADQASFSGAIDAASFTQSAAAGLTTFDGALNLSGAFDFTGQALTLNDSLNSGSTVEITNAGLLTTATAADITATGAFTQNGAGSSSIAGDISTTDSNISFLRAVTLTGPVALSTGSGAGTITFSSILDATTAGSETLALTAGSGDINFSDVVGGTNRLGAVTINQAADVTLSKAFSAASFSQASGTAGTGIFTLGGDLNTDTGAITISSATVDLNASITTTAGGANGLVTINAGSGGLDLASGKSITTTATTAGTQSGAIDINSDGNINLIGDLITTGSAGAAGGNVTIDTTGTTATLSISDITTSGGAAASSSNGNGGAAGSIGLTTAGTITLDNSTITAAGGLGDGTGSQGAGATISFSNAVALTTGAATVDTGATTGDIAFSSTINGAQGLTLTAGTGDVTLSGITGTAAGDANALASLTVTSANNAALNNVFATGAQSITATNITLTGTTYDADSSTITLTGDTGLDQNTAISAATTSFNGTLDSSNTGGATPASTFRTLGITGNAVFGGAVGNTFALGGLTVSRTSNLNGGSINTTGAQTYTAAVTLAANTTLTSGGGAITFGSTLNSDGTARDLTLTAGSGDIDFDGIVGGATGGTLGAVTMNAANNVTLGDTFSAASFSQATAGTGVFQLDGNLTASTGAITINSKVVDLNASIATTGGNDGSTDNGLVTINAGIGDSNGLALSLVSGETISTTAASDGTQSGAININSVGNVDLAGNLITTGSAAAAGGAITITTSGSGTSISLASLNTSGGAAGNGTGSAGGDAGTIALETPNGQGIVLNNSVIRSAGGLGDGAGAQGAGADISFKNVLSLNGGSITIDTGATGGDLELLGALDGGLAVTLTAGTGDLNIGLNGAIGAITPLASLNISAANLYLFDVTTTGDQTYTSAGTITTNSTYRSAGGAITFAGAVVTNGELVVDTTNNGAVTAGGAVSFQGTVNSAQGLANNLTVDAGNGSVAFDAAIGSTTTLGAITLNTAGLTDIQSTVNAVSISTDAPGTVQLGGNITATGAAGVVFNENASLANTLTITASDANGAVTFGSSLDSAASLASSLTITAGGPVSFVGAVGAASNGELGALTVNTGALTDFQSTLQVASVLTDAPGTVQLGGNITATGSAGAVFNENATLTADVTINTSAGNGPITFGGAITNTDGESLVFDSGNDGDITVTGDIGDLGTGVVTITDANDATFFGSVTAASFTQIDGSGTTTFSDAISLSGDLDFNGTNLTLSGSGNVIGGAMTVTNTGVFTTGNGADLSAGSFAQSGGGTNVIGEDISTTTGALSFTGDLKLTGDQNEAITFSTNGAAGSDITIGGDITNTAGESLVFDSGNDGDITVSGDIGDLGTGAVTITDANDATFFGSVTAASFTQIDGSGTTTFSDAISLSGDLDFNGTNLTLSGSGNVIGGAMTVTNTGVFTTGNGADLSAGSFAQSGGGTNVIGEDISTTTGALSFTGDLKLTGDQNEAITFSTNGAAGSDITIGGDITNTAGESLVFDSGNDGDITVSGDIGDLGTGAVTITDANDATFFGSVTAASFTQIDGSGTTTFSDAISLSGDLDFNGTNLTLSGSGNVIGGAMTVTNTGVFTTGNAADLTAGSFAQSGGGTNVIGEDITTTTGALSFTGDLKLTGDQNEAITFSTNGAAGSDITIGGDITNTAGESLVFDSGNDGDITVTGDIGDLGTGVVTITDANDATFSGSVTAASFTQIDGSGTTTFSDAISLSGDLDFNGTNLTLSGSGNVIGGAMTVTNTGVFTTGNAADLTAGSFAQSGGGTNVIGEDITTTTGALSFTGDLKLTGDQNEAITFSTNGAAGSDITIGGDITNTAGESLVFDSGNDGDITVTGDIGDLGTGAVTITDANDATFFGSVTAASFTQIDGSGTTTFSDAISLSGDLDFNGTNLTLSGSGNVIGGAMTVTNTGVFTTGNAADLTAGSFAQSGGGTNVIGEDITTTTGALSFTGDLKLTGDQNEAITFSTNGAAGSDITIGGDITNTAGESLVFDSGNDGDITVSGDIGDLGTGAVTITDANDATFNGTLTAASFTQIDGTGTTTFSDAISLSGDLDFNGTNLVINGVPNTIGADLLVTNSGVFSTGNNAVLAISGALIQDGTGSNTIGADITADQGITIATDITLDGDQDEVITFSTDGNPDSDITIGGAISNTDGESLVFDSGNTGNIAVSGDIGDLGTGSISITNANDATFTGSVTAASFSQSAGTGTTTFSDAITLTGDLDFNGTNLVINGQPNSIGADLLVTNTGTFTTGDNAVLSIAGELIQDGTGTSTIGADITADQGISIATDITLDGSANEVITFSTDGTAGSDITIGGAITNTNAESLVFDSGAAGNIAVSGDITLTDGPSTPSVGGDLTINTANDVLISGILDLTGDLEAITLGQVSLGITSIQGNASITSSNGPILQTGHITVDGDTDLNAGLGDINLPGPGNDFSGSLSAQGRVVRVLAVGLQIPAPPSSGGGGSGGSQAPTAPEQTTVPPTTTSEPRPEPSAPTPPAPPVPPSTTSEPRPEPPVLPGVVPTTTQPTPQAPSVREVIASSTSTALPSLLTNTDPSVVRVQTSTTTTTVLNPISSLTNSQPLAAATTGAATPYPLSMSNPSPSIATAPQTITTTSGSERTSATGNPSLDRQDSSSETTGEATAARGTGSVVQEGPLKPNFRVENQQPERYNMGTASFEIQPGNEVCVSGSGCGSSVTTNTSQEQISPTGTISSPTDDDALSRSNGDDTKPKSQLLSRISRWLMRSL